MENFDLEKLRFPIGAFCAPSKYDDKIIVEQIEAIASFASRLKNEVSHLSDVQLDTVYRPEGWTIRQVVHHCADSHMNCLIRIKLMLTEETPTIKPYKEELWSELNDNRTMPIAPSLVLLEGLHFRLQWMLSNLTASDFERRYIHPQYGKEFPLYEVVALYAWHGDHHLAHIVSLKKRQGWQ
ncbi:MAG: putative metal-dependent hydrolase [Flavobacterium sp.]|nr:putative metal-dependent hydrolase [Flavobacterium sp.]